MAAHPNFRSARFHVEDRGHVSPCHVWALGKTKGGYGREGARDGTTRLVLAHRAAWERERGPIPTGLQLDHLCRQRDCVRVDHLELVTNAENSRRGAAAKISSAEAAAIRTLYTGTPGGLSYREIGAIYGLSCTQIKKIVDGDAWSPTEKEHAC